MLHLPRVRDETNKQMNSGRAELTFVLILMAVILVFAIAAVIVFIRTWRKERK